MFQIPKLEARTSHPSSFDLDIVAVYQDSGKKPIPPKGRYAGLVEKFKKNEAFQGAIGNAQFVRFSGKSSENTLLVGMGLTTELTEEKIRQAGGFAFARLRAEKCRNLVVHVDTLVEARGLKSEMSPARMARAFAEGLVFPAYQFDSFKSKKSETPLLAQITFLTAEKNIKAHLDAELLRVSVEAEAMWVTRDWSNTPSNYGTPEFYANEAKKLGKFAGLNVRVLTEAEAAREKMGLFLAVGQGAAREGRIVVAEYKPKNVRTPKTIALVGKGVTFDSGGISIKPAMRMEEMKHDMTGAATVMGAVLLAAKLKIQNRVIGIMAFTENMPSGNAVQPGNIITSRAGKTVEIINTDAEGRLILADALDFAHDFKPDVIVNVATLTGAVSIALGKQCCAIMGNDDALVESIRRAGEMNGERIWELPAWDEYFEDMKSDYADMKNSCNDSYGGAIRGGIFLKQFIRKGMPWAHLDIAATSSNISHVPYFPKRGANGLYVRTLAQFAEEFG
ncbi:MAG: leucyl aminopeptidase [Bdellovibrionota bacterium]